MWAVVQREVFGFENCVCGYYELVEFKEKQEDEDKVLQGSVA